MNMNITTLGTRASKFKRKFLLLFFGSGTQRRTSPKSDFATNTNMSFSCLLPHTFENGMKIECF